VRTPLIVFGHTHEPEQVPLTSGATYFNTGTWASDDLRHAFTHLRVVCGAGLGAVRAELLQWRRGASAPYDAVEAGAAWSGAAGRDGAPQRNG
jgi:hypothetical protein